MNYVYILTNPAMPGLVKVGRTESPVEQRMREIDKTGVPLPFQCFYAAEVQDSTKVERKLHEAFADRRVRVNREFFKVDPSQVQAALELAAIRDVTPRGDVVEAESDVEALQNYAQRYGKYSFSFVGIEHGSVLTFVRDETVQAVVASDSRVDFRGEVMSLSAAALKALAEQGVTWTTCAGPQYWLYQGETLSQLRTAKLEAQESEE